MKASLLSLPAACLIVASCGSGGPMSMSSSSSFDPLNAAGSVSQSTSMSSSTYKPGEFVHALMNNTALFKTRPTGNASADRLLSRGTQMKVISDDGSYAKVELDDGDIGFVPSIQVGNDSQAMSAEPSSGSEVQVWPPVESTIPLPPSESSSVPETPATDGAPTLPPVIDPDAPADLPPLPDDAPTPGLGAEPPVDMPEMEAPKEKADAAGEESTPPSKDEAPEVD
ncbi:hypothetical protein [Haloferula sargassicola]|uniref:SH3 domain-containing protein n=1 Tax=Haloferula sargassicola TaxID=490096 RepID=A0ABP9UVW4_9BACT